MIFCLPLNREPLAKSLLVLDTMSHHRNAHEELQWRSRKESDESTDTVPPHWHKDSLLCLSHLHCCGGPKKHNLVFHLHFLATSLPVGTDLEDPSRLPSSIILASSLGIVGKILRNFGTCSDFFTFIFSLK